MLRGEADVRDAIRKAIRPYELAGVRLQWGGSHRAGEAVLMLGDTVETVVYSKMATKDDLKPIMQRVRQALRKLGATHVDVHALRDREHKRQGDLVAAAADKLFGGRAVVRPRDSRFGRG